MITIIDNYDSFTYNLVQYLGELGEKIVVVRNDAISVSEIEESRPEAIVISPGPGKPTEAGISSEVILALGKRLPILGVCLGHQCIAEAFGGHVKRAPTLMHGKISKIYHNQNLFFQDIPNPFEATRYHSLIVSRKGLPAELEVTATTREEEIMALQHRRYPIFGVQFHPESILTLQGKKMLQNFLNLTDREDEGRALQEIEL